MPNDALVAQELKSLQAELAAVQPARVEPPTAAAPPAAAGAAAGGGSPSSADDANEQEALDYLREFTDEATEFFKEAERNIAVHPTESVVAALLIGILIGRLLGRR